MKDQDIPASLGSQFLEEDIYRKLEMKKMS